MRTYKRLRRHGSRARGFIADVARRQPGVFAHWRWGSLGDEHLPSDDERPESRAERRARRSPPASATRETRYPRIHPAGISTSGSASRDHATSCAS
jgi:hypothetical protein